MVEKGPDAFRTISEAVSEVGAPAHMLRFWETRFNFIRPMRRAGGRRFYRPQDVLVLKILRRLLQLEGRSIGDLRRLTRREILELAETHQPGGVSPAGPARAFQGLQSALAAAVCAKKRLDGLLDRTAH